MKKKAFFFFIIFILGNCSGKNEEKKYDLRMRRGYGFEEKDTNKKIIRVSRRFVKEVIKKRFDYFKIESKKTRKVIDKYFGNKNYKVIWNYRIGDNNKRVYFAIEECLKLYNGFRKGIIVQDDGEVKVYFDPDKGIYGPNKNIVDFKRIGFKKGEVGYFIMSSSGKYIKKYAEDSKVRPGIYVYITDKNFNAMLNPIDKLTPSAWFAMISLKKGGIILFNFAEEFGEINKFYKDLKKEYQNYKEQKENGITVKSAALKTEYERLKKAGMVDEG